MLELKLIHVSKRGHWIAQKEFSFPHIYAFVFYAAMSMGKILKSLDGWMNNHLQIKIQCGARTKSYYLHHYRHSISRSITDYNCIGFSWLVEYRVGGGFLIPTALFKLQSSRRVLSGQGADLREVPKTIGTTWWAN